jgi:hypothetical protein
MAFAQFRRVAGDPEAERRLRGLAKKRHYRLLRGPFPIARCQAQADRPQILPQSSEDSPEKRASQRCGQGLSGGAGRGAGAPQGPRHDDQDRAEAWIVAPQHPRVTSVRGLREGAPQHLRPQLTELAEQV